MIQLTSNFTTPISSNECVPLFSVFCGIWVLGKGCEGVTWVGDSVPVPGSVIIQCLQHHPHGEREHPSKEAIKDQIEEEDES